MDFDEWARQVAKVITGNPEDPEALGLVMESPSWRQMFDEGKTPRAAYDEQTVRMRFSDWDDDPPEMGEAQWNEFRVRLRQEIVRTHDSQTAFADALADQAHGIRGTSLRSLVNYLNGETLPSKAWVRQAAQLINVRPEYLLYGQKPRTDDPPPPPPFRYIVGDHVNSAVPREIFAHMNADYLLAFPWTARDIMLRFLWDYYKDRPGVPSQYELRRTTKRFFHPMLTSGTRLSYAEAVATALSLAASAYLTAGISAPQN